LKIGVHNAGPHFGPRPSVQSGPAAQETRPTQPTWRAQHSHGGAVGPGSSADKVRWERWCKHRGSQGRAPDNEAVKGLPEWCGSGEVRRRQRDDGIRGGAGASVFDDGGLGDLQHRRTKREVREGSKQQERAQRRGSPGRGG
jgi:hypothetical protein